MSENFLNKEVSQNGKQKTGMFFVVALIILGAGFLIYKNFFKQKEYSIEEKLKILNSIEGPKDEISEQEKKEVLDSIEANTKIDQGYSIQQRMDFLKDI